MDKGKFFEVEISHPGFFGAETSATLELPAAPYELLGVLDKARIIDERVLYSVEITGCELDYLPQFLGPGINLHERNYLARRLTALNQWEPDCFEGMMMMDTVRTEYATIAVERLTNITHRTEHFQVAHEAHDDSSLGKFYAENNFTPQFDALTDQVYAWLDFERICKEMCEVEGEGGVFTAHGYMVQNGEIAQAYRGGAAVPLEKPDYTVLLHVMKGYFSDPEYDGGSSVPLKLPAKDEAVSLDAGGCGSGIAARVRLLCGGLHRAPAFGADCR